MIPFLSTLAAHYIIVLFLFLNLAIGFWAHRQSKANSFEDYALASRSLPTGVLVFSLLATVLDREYLAEPSWTYYQGVLNLAYLIAFLLSFVLVGTFIAPYLVYFNGSITIGDLMETFYGRTAKVITGLVSCVVSIFIITAQIRAIGRISHQFLDIDPVIAIISIGSIVVLYSIFGGMRAVSYTDIVQAIGALFALSLVTSALLQKLDGSYVLVKKLSMHHPNKLNIISHPNFYNKVKAVIFWTFSGTMLFSPPVVHRMLVVQDKKQVRKMWYTGAFLHGIICLMVTVIGLGAIVGKEKLGITDTTSDILLTVAKNLFRTPSWTIDFIFIGFLGILLSSMDSFLHAMGISLSRDVVNPIKQWFGSPHLDDKQIISYSKVAISLVGTLAILFGFILGDFSLSFTNSWLYDYTVLLSGLIVFPLIFGIIGLKTDKHLWFSFCITYSLCLNVLLFLKWTPCDSYIFSISFATLAYFATHIYQNGGIVTLKRSELTIAEQLWIPTWQGTVQYVKSWLLAPFQLHTLASRKTVDSPMHSLSFSMLIFALYTFSSVMTGGVNDLGLANFMAGIHVVGITLCAGLMLEGIWPDRFKPYFALYWFFTLFYCLAFGSTLAFLRAHGDTMTVIKWIFNFMLLAALVDSMSFVTLSCLGSGLAMALWYGVFGSLPADLLGSIGLPGVYLLFGLLVIVVLFERSKERDLKERFYIKNAFSHAMTHESKQPLSEISVLSTLQQRAIDELSPMQNAQGEKGFWIPASKQDMLQNGSQQIGKAVQEIKHEFGRFNKLIEDEISTLEKEKVSMRSLIESIVPTLPKKHTSRIKVKVECTKDFKASVMRPLFANVFANLLKNAYLHGNASEMHIHIEGGKRKLSIRDNGRGIKVESLPRIFELHFTTGGQTSNGVGLALVKSIVQASGGKISCHSRHGDKDSFTEFVMEFPEV